VWKKITARHGRIPPSKVADQDLGKTVVIRLDGTIQIAHSEKEGAAGTYKGSFGHHPLGAWCDNTNENLAFRLRPGNAGANTATDNIAVLDEAIAQIPAPHRRDLLVTLDGAGATRDLITHIKDRVRTGKTTGLDHLPSRSLRINHAWCLDATIATDLLAWTQLLCLDGDLAAAEPDTLRYRLLHTPPPASSAANANERSKSRRPGPGHTSSPTPSTLPSP
jgi:hypothetical protein